MKFTKKEPSLVLHGVYIVALFCLLGLSVVILWNNSVAWFAENKRVTAGGASVTLQDLNITDKYYATAINGTDYTEITAWDHLFENLMPGDAVKLKAEFTNNSDADRTFDICFENINGDDTPLTKTVETNSGGAASTETRYYYLGTQLKITAITFNEGGTVGDSALNGFLTEPSENKIYYTATKAPNSIKLGSANISAGETCTVEFTVEFVNYDDIDQNDYQGYGKPVTAEDGTEAAANETCLRQIVCYVKE